MKKVAIVYQVIFHYRIPFYNKIYSDPELKSIVYYGLDNPYNKNKSFKTKYDFSNKKLFTIFIPFGKEHNRFKKVMPFFPSLFFNLVFYNPSIILCEGSSALPNSLITYFYAKLFNKKFIWWSLGSIEKNTKNNWLRNIIDFICKYLEKNSDAIFTYSNQGKNYFIQKRGVNPDKIFVGINVIDTAERLKEINVMKSHIIKDENIFQIIFVGSIIKEKRLEILIDAFNILYNKYNNKVRLVIVGDGIYLDNIKNYASTKNSKNIFFVGKIIDGISKYFLQSDVFVLPGLGGLAISDAMIHGLPVIAGKADGTEIDLVTNETGFLHEELNVDILVKDLELLFLNPELKRYLSENAFNLLKNNYSFENYYKIFKDMIKTL